jgi:hypothetical protein
MRQKWKGNKCKGEESFEFKWMWRRDENKANYRKSLTLRMYDICWDSRSLFLDEPWGSWGEKRVARRGERLSISPQTSLNIFNEKKIDQLILTIFQLSFLFIGLSQQLISTICFTKHQTRNIITGNLSTNTKNSRSAFLLLWIVISTYESWWIFLAEHFPKFMSSEQKHDSNGRKNLDKFFRGVVGATFASMIYFIGKKLIDSPK